MPEKRQSRSVRESRRERMPIHRASPRRGRLKARKTCQYSFMVGGFGAVAGAQSGVEFVAALARVTAT